MKVNPNEIRFWKLVGLSWFRDGSVNNRNETAWTVSFLSTAIATLFGFPLDSLHSLRGIDKIKATLSHRIKITDLIKGVLRYLS